MTRHLLGLGHQRIAFVGNVRGGRTTQKRQAGFESAMHSAELLVRKEYVVEDVLNGRLENGLAGVRALLALPERPTALVCFNDMYAVGALHTLKQAGFRVPDDCAVVGFDNIPLSALVSPALTTFDQPKHALGREAAHMMLGLSGAMPESASDPQSDIVTLRGEILVRRFHRAASKLAL